MYDTDYLHTRDMIADLSRVGSRNWAESQAKAAGYRRTLDQIRALPEPRTNGVVETRRTGGLIRRIGRWL